MRTITTVKRIVGTLPKPTHHGVPAAGFHKWPAGDANRRPPNPVENQMHQQLDQLTRSPATSFFSTSTEAPMSIGKQVGLQLFLNEFPVIESELGKPHPVFDLLLREADRGEIDRHEFAIVRDYLLVSIAMKNTLWDRTRPDVAAAENVLNVIGAKVFGLKNATAADAFERVAKNPLVASALGTIFRAWEVAPVFVELAGRIAFGQGANATTGTPAPLLDALLLMSSKLPQNLFQAVVIPFIYDHNQVNDWENAARDGSESDWSVHRAEAKVLARTHIGSVKEANEVLDAMRQYGAAENVIWAALQRAKEGTAVLDI